MTLSNSTIKYLEGDLFENIKNINEKIIIPHVCNNVGAWGSGFVVPLGKNFPKARESYLKYRHSLGTIQAVKINEKVSVVNMIAQRGIFGRVKISYQALEECLDKTGLLARLNHASIHAPKFGSGIAGGDWKVIESMILDRWVGLDVNIYVFRG